MQTGGNPQRTSTRALLLQVSFNHQRLEPFLLDFTRLSHPRINLNPGS
jgi:hypothetical protein